MNAADFKNPLARHRGMLGQNEAARQAKEALSGVVPTVKAAFAIDGTGSMANDTGVVQAHLAPFINGVLADSFATIPQDIQAQISPDRSIEWTRINFGDGNPACRYGLSIFRGTQADDARIDMPYLTVQNGVARFPAQHLNAGADEISRQFREYQVSMNGGGNSGESSPEAALATMGLLPQNQVQRDLLIALLNDCRSVQYGSRAHHDYGGMRDPRVSEGNDVVPYLEQLIAGGAIPVQALHTLKQESISPGPADIRILVTDEPAAGYATTIEQLEQVRTEGSFFALITPHDVYERFWRNHIQALGATWFDLNDLANTRANVSGLNFAQKGFSDAVSNQVGKAVVRDISKVLQLTSGSRQGSSNSIVRK